MAERNIAAVLLSPKTDFVIQERPIPAPGPGELVIRTHAVGLNPIDWKRQAWDFLVSSYPAVLGNDVTGTIHSVGPNISNAKLVPSTRVISFAHGVSSQSPENAAFQHYVLVHANATTPLPDSLSFAQGATLPTAISTAVMALVDVLGFAPPPISPSISLPASNSTADENIILVWGGASSGVGSMTIQLARLSGFTVFTTASPTHHRRLENLGAEVVVDYHDPALAISQLVNAAKERGKRIAHVVDAISSAETLQSIVKILGHFQHPQDASGDGNRDGDKEGVKGGKAKIAHTLAWPEDVAKPDWLQARQVRGDELWTRREDLCDWLYGQALPTWLEEKTLVLSPERVVGKGVDAIQAGLRELQKGVSGEKLVVEI